jgi:cytoskeleton protein RodZ
MEGGHHTPHSSNGEGKIGRVLEQARRDRGLSLEEVERATKIRKRYLAGLEKDDYTVLPDAVYAQGFLKTYANFLGLDGAELSEELKVRRKPRRERGLNYAPPTKSEFERPILNPGGVSGAEKRKIPRSTVVAVALAVLIVAALIGALYFVGLNVRASAGDDAPAQATAGREDRRPAVGTNGAEGGEQVSNEAPLDTLRVGVSVEGSPAWIRVTSDAETVFEQVAEPGYSRTFEARRVVVIEAGNAGAVSVEINGQGVGPLGEPGQVIDRSFTLKPAG